MRVTVFIVCGVCDELREKAFMCTDSNFIGHGLSGELEFYNASAARSRRSKQIKLKVSDEYR